VKGEIINHIAWMHGCIDALRKNRDSHNINMALHKSQRTKKFNPGLMEGFNIVFFFHLSTILEINYLAPSFLIYYIGW
jgi:hypothetical protein